MKLRSTGYLLFATLATACVVPAISAPPVLVVTVLTAGATAAVNPGDPCSALPDQLTGAGQFTTVRGGDITYEWRAVIGVSESLLVSGVLRNVPRDKLITVPPLSATLAGHLPRFTYGVKLRVIDKKGDSTSNTKAAPALPNLPPVAFDLRWVRSGDPCEEVTTTPAAAVHTSQRSLAATPAEGTESTPGVFPQITAAGCDPDGDTLRFRFVWDGNTGGAVALNGIHPSGAPDATLQTAKYSGVALADSAAHTLKVIADDSPSAGVGLMLSDDTNSVDVVDPREELRKELAGLGFSSIESFEQAMAPRIERAQSDFRIHGWGTAGEANYYVTNPPTAYTYNGLGAGSGPLPLLLDGRGGLPAPSDVSGVLLRLRGWVEAPTHTALSLADEVSGEYFAALLNAESGDIGLNAYADLVRAPAIWDSMSNSFLSSPVLPEIYRRSSGGPGSFPRQNADEFALPDQLFVAQGLDMMKVGPFAQLGVLPPFNSTAAAQDTADLGRIFNDQTMDFVSPATGGTGDVQRGARHRPHIPRVRVQNAVKDGATTPVVCWTFTDADPTHVQSAALVSVDAGMFVSAAGANSHPLAGLSAGTHQVTIRVQDQGGFWAQRTVQFPAP